tara:strand:+ start:249 stop:434 length:186 start_codon:yes stop_codon:yes gene_type:complete
MYQHDIKNKLKTKKRNVKVLFIVGDSGTTIKHTVDEKTGKLRKLCKAYYSDDTSDTICSME